MSDPSRPSLTLNKARIDWDLDAGAFSFFGIDSALFWLNPSLLRMLAPLAQEIGRDLFRLMVASSSSVGTKEDYSAMVTVLADNFPDGFLGLGQRGVRRGLGAL